MWLALAVGSAFFAGITAILAKIGIRDVESNLATAIRTGVVLILAWMLVFVVGTQSTITDLSGTTWLFLILSGLATGASWLCYFRALQVGDINKVVPVDKSSTVLTMIFAIIFLGEPFNAMVVVALVAIGIGTMMMIERREDAPVRIADPPSNSGAAVAMVAATPARKSWLVYALGSAVFAALTAILGKVGIVGVDSTLGTAIRTGVVLIMAWIIVVAQRTTALFRNIDGKSWLFLILSGLATGLSWLCYYRALQDGPASVVVPIDKLSILVSIAFGLVVFHERLSLRATLGLALIVIGTLVLVL